MIVTDRLGDVQTISQSRLTITQGLNFPREDITIQSGAEFTKQLGCYEWSTSVYLHQVSQEIRQLHSVRQD